MKEVVLISIDRTQGKLLFVREKKTGPPREVSITPAVWQSIDQRRCDIVEKMDKFSLGDVAQEIPLNEKGTRKIKLGDYKAELFAGIMAYRAGGLGEVLPQYTMQFRFPEFRRLLDNRELIHEKVATFLPKVSPYSTNSDIEKAYGYFWKWVDGTLDQDERETNAVASAHPFWHRDDAMADAYKMRQSAPKNAQLEIEERFVPAWKVEDHVQKMIWFLLMVKINAEVAKHPCAGCVDHKSTKEDHDCLQWGEGDKMKSLSDTFTTKAVAQLDKNRSQLECMVTEGRRMMSAPHVWAKQAVANALQYLTVSCCSKSREPMMKFLSDHENHRFKMVERAYLKSVAALPNESCPAKRAKTD